MAGYETGRYGADYLFPPRYQVSNVSAEDEALISERQSYISSATTNSYTPGGNPYQQQHFHHHHQPSISSVGHEPEPEYKSASFAAGPKPEYWNTVWLTKTTVGAFIASGFLIIAALVALYVVSDKDSGLVSQTARFRYTWTYGPTAVLVLVASLWIRVDHWAKTLVPYQRLHKASTPGNQSVLLDYLSPWNMIALVSSIKNRDFAVTSAIAGSILLQITIVVSTSILLLEARQVPMSLTLPVTRGFLNTAPNISYAAIDGTPATRFFGIAGGRIAYPPTISPDMVVENFYQNSTSSVNYTYSARVAGMSATLDCQPLKQENNSYRVSIPWKSVLGVGFAIDINTTDCFIRGVPIGLGPDHAPGIPLKVTVSSQGWWLNATCNDNYTNYALPPFSSNPSFIPTPKPGFNDKRMIFTTSTVQWTAEDMLNGSGMRRPTWVQNYTGIICKPSYSIDDYIVTYSPQQNNTQQPFTAVKQQGTSRKVTNFGDTDLSPLLYAALSKGRLYNSAQRPEDAAAVVEDDAGYVRPEDTFFMVMNQLNGVSQTSAFLNQSALLEYAPRAFTGLLAQVFERHFTTPTNKQVAAQALLTDNRLVLKTTPTVLMIILLFLSIISFMTLFVTRPKNVVPLDPQTLSAQAKLVASSSHFSQDLQRFTGVRANLMSEELSKCDFRSVVQPSEHGPSFVISKTSSTNISQAAPEIPPTAHHVWWRPFTSKALFTIVLMFCTLAIIASLEVLQHLSDSQDGILTFEDWGSRHTLITAIPAAAMTVIALSFAAVNFNVALIAPFAALKHRPRPHQHGLDVALIGKPSVLSLYGAGRHFMKLPFFSLIAVLVGSFLTIVVSGLYYVEYVPAKTPVTLQRVDQFNYTSAQLRKGDNSASVATKLIWYENATYPPGTYNHLVFPRLALTGSQGGSLNTTYVDIQVPAIRPKVNCITIPPAAIRYDARYYDNALIHSASSPPMMNMSAFIDLPCFENPDGTGKVTTCKYPWNMVLTYKEGQKDEIVGTLYSSNAYGSIQCLGYKPNNATWVGDPRNLPKFPLANGCPSFHFGYGTVTTKRINNITMSQERPFVTGGVCFQNLEEVQTKLRLNLPKLTISASPPPIVLEDTAKLVNITIGNYTGPNYFNSLETLLWTLFPNVPDETVGPFYQALFEGRTHLKPEDLLGSANLPRLLNSTNDLYAVYMAQAINSNFRYNTTSALAQTSSGTSTGSTQSQFSGIMSDTARQRLKQQNQLKITLQVMLGVMTVCGLVVFIFSDRKPILPHNPCTIAGTMVLFAGSEMATRKLVAPGSEWSHNNNIWEGWFFSLGWWGTQENPRYGIDVGKAEKSIEDLPHQSNAPAPGPTGGRWASRGMPGDSDGYSFDSNRKTHGSVDVYEMNMFERSNSRVSVDMGDMGQQFTYDHIYPKGYSDYGYSGR